MGWHPIRDVRLRLLGHVLRHSIVNVQVIQMNHWNVIGMHRQLRDDTVVENERHDVVVVDKNDDEYCCF